MKSQHTMYTAVEDLSMIDTYYQALIHRDPDYADRFVVGVCTTGIFCISICSARKPKKENCTFFATASDALRHGYRPCKVCHPTVVSGADAAVADLLQYVQLHPMTRIDDAALRDRGLSADRIRRYFKSHFGITFQAYLRMQRINAAYRSLQEGKSISEVSLQAGYESISGFGYAFKCVMGSSPQRILNSQQILIQRLTTPIGPMYACATDRGVCLLEFTDRRMLETEFADLQNRLDAIIMHGRNKHLDQLQEELDEYFAGTRTHFDVNLDAPTTPFRAEVWEALQQIAYGDTISYAHQAKKLGNPGAVRAVASANGHNRIAIVIPCHRVVGSDGSLTGYAGGLDRKKWLLDHEKRVAGKVRQTTIW